MLASAGLRSACRAEGLRWNKPMPSPRFGWPWPFSPRWWPAICGFPWPWWRSAWGWSPHWWPTEWFYPGALGANLDWLRFIASMGAVLLTFLAGAELDPAAMKAKLKEVVVVGLFGFVAPFLGCTAIARFVLGWDSSASWLAGIALSTTSMAVVYAVMLESGFNKTEFGKGILGACFVNDLGTVIALGICFAPFTYRTAVFVGCLRRPSRPPAVDHVATDRPVRQPDRRHQDQVDPVGAAGARARWRCGLAVKRCCLPTSRACCWPRPSAAITSTSAGCER